MNLRGPAKRFRREPAAVGEVPTGAAELSISMVPAAIEMAGPPVIAVTGAGVRDRLTAVTGVGWFRKARGGGAAVRRRIQAAIEAETAKVPEASAEAIEAELARIMSHRPSREAPGRRRWSRSLPVRQPWNNPGDYEPTAAADLRIRLVPH